MFIKILTNKYFWISGVILLLIFGIIYYYNANVKARAELDKATQNLKAYIVELDSVTTQNRVFKLDINQLNYYNDSILKKLNVVRKELKIKDSKIQSMQYLLSEASKIDTLLIRDTIFRDSGFKLDTLIENKPHYRLQLGLKFPNEIIVNPSFLSELYIIMSSKKETIDPPKDFFLWRMFQKKHTVVEVNIVEKNPFIIQKKNKFVEIIK